ncbi:hypothetical protein GCM10009660_33400 [Catellatospora bangladeshensis]|uniref:Uncharacterized protein n=1 Tax=Saccharothrix algeriensis TaxID=173560 RepID=A0ABS2S4F1_9PSEU|nr:hypothetical protein [Saccharothrix algeriensis]
MEIGTFVTDGMLFDALPRNATGKVLERDPRWVSCAAGDR